jgi:thiamine-monophosphate kinase
LCPQPVYRHGAQVGDDVYVSGCLGDAAAGLKLWLDGISHSKELSGDESYLVSRFHRPTPRVELGMALKGIAHAMLDISDGLLSDLTHIAKASQVSVVIDECNLPLSESVLRCFDQPQAVRWALSGGDDYELAFTAPSDMRQELENIALDLGVRLTRIGQVIQSDDEHKVFVSNASEAIVTTGYNHFSD